MTLEEKLRISILMNMPSPKIDEWEWEQMDKELTDLGYDLEQLERDNPYNQWMYEE
jgi:hypothetical protein